MRESTSAPRRKAKEAFLAMRVEQVLPKDKILEIYLNEIYLGSGAYGIAAASQTYFNKPLDQLDDAEAAFLAALPKSPTNYNPVRFPDAARGRRNWVLERMADIGAITHDAARVAEAQPLTTRSFTRPGPGNNSVVALYGTLLFKHAHTAQAGRWRKANFCSQFRIAKAAIVFKLSQNGFGYTIWHNLSFAV